MASVEAREKFYHPYTPYGIQLQFMSSLYDCIDAGKVAIFESPTGTGKSLSLICGALTWLRDHKRKEFLKSVDGLSADDDEPDWMREHFKKERTQALTQKWQDLEERLARIREEDERRKRKKPAHEFQKTSKKQKIDIQGPRTEEDSSFELDEYESDKDIPKISIAGLNDTQLLSTRTIALLEQFKKKTSNRNENEAETESSTRIYYCSRTHSQLSQFAQELRRVNLPSSLPSLEGDARSTKEEGDHLEEVIKHLTLGSRKQLCINPQVLKLANATAINERCMELQQPGTAAGKKCSYLPTKDSEDLLLDFRDRVLSTVQDIEDISSVGKELSICPYYAARKAIDQCEIITLPYPLLLQKSSREALNLSLRGHVVIIDEAHNLMDAISNIHSVSVTLDQLCLSMSQLSTYARKFQKRLKGKNRVYVTQVLRLIGALVTNIRTLAEKENSPETVVKHSELVSGKGVDQINPFKLTRYLQESKLARKVDGYVEHVNAQNDTTEKKPREKATVPVLFQVQSFILTLMNPSDEGQLFLSRSDGDVQLTYMLLDPTNHFRDIVDEARAVILAGGTMSPMSDYADHLFSYLPPGKLDTFSFGHVIPPENLAARTLCKGVLGNDFNFTYDQRNSDSLIIDLGKTIASLCAVIPDGVVAFFPSYDYLNRVLTVWKTPPKSGSGVSTLAEIEKYKPVVHERNDIKSDRNTDDVLQDYSKKVESGSGALLLAVVGGRLSEGINFSDRLGRGVLIVGLPFPNIHSAVWKAKIRQVEKQTFNKLTRKRERISMYVWEGQQYLEKGKAAGREFVENACMRAVNQCIGRAIRHRNDYAGIILMDRRYQTKNIQGKLPAWIRQSLKGSETSSVCEDLNSFFNSHRST